MIFNSIIFIQIFLPVTISVNFLFRKNVKLQNVWLLAASFLFYGWCNIKILLFLCAFCLVNYGFSILISRIKNRPKKALLILGVSLNVFCLFLVKYLNFSIEITNKLFGTAISPFENLLVPIGISFLVFTSISYLVDIYNSKVEVITNPIDSFLYFSFFPKVSQGPITVCSEIKPNLESRNVTLEDFSNGLRRFCCGLAKKVLLADILGKAVDGVFGSMDSGITTLTAWATLLSYTFQIYFDFSGYTDMAIGIGKMLGFNLPENFDFPYISKSVSEFWRRWHMTLGRWYRNYIYIPLGGNRCSTARMIFNLSVVWFLTGLWHGAAVNYILWGLYFGVFVIIEKFVSKKNWYIKIPTFVKWLATFFIVVMGWLLFRAGNISQIFVYLKALFGIGNTGNAVYSFGYYYDILTCIIFAVSALFSFPLFKVKGKYGKILSDIGIVIIFILSIIFMVNSTYTSFIYFQF